MEFKNFPKIARLNRECVITEKIDGTNSQVVIIEDKDFWELLEGYTGDSVEAFLLKCGLFSIQIEEKQFHMFAGSRDRWLSIGDDNYGFAKWVKENGVELIKLGEGIHYGEWWGSGIQRGYGLTKGDKRFSLFNTGRWADRKENPELKENDKRAHCPNCCSVVPIIYEGWFNTEIANECLQWLRENGSYAAPGFMKPEGIVIYHKHANTYFKVTLENDNKPKGENK